MFIKIWRNSYLFNGELKGGHIVMNPGEYFKIITSNYSIENVFEPTDAEAIKRRFTIVCFNNELEKHVATNKSILMKKQSEINHEEALIEKILCSMFPSAFPRP